MSYYVYRFQKALVGQLVNDSLIGSAMRQGDSRFSYLLLDRPCDILHNSESFIEYLRICRFLNVENSNMSVFDIQPNWRDPPNTSPQIKPQKEMQF